MCISTSTTPLLSYQHSTPAPLPPTPSRQRRNGLLGGLLAVGLLLAAVMVPNIRVSTRDATTTTITTATTKNTAFPKELYASVMDPCQPKRLRLAQATNVNDGESHTVDMTLTFHLEYPTCLCLMQDDGVQPSVVYGRVQDGGDGDGGDSDTETVVQATDPLQFNYTSDQTNGTVFQSDLVYHVRLSNLQAGLQQYWYRIQVTTETSASTAPIPESEPSLRRSLRPNHMIATTTTTTDTYHFQTPPLSGQPTRIALVGDLGQTENSTRTMHNIYQASVASSSEQDNEQQQPISHIIIAGDMSYADSDPYRWNSWFDLLEPLLRSTPLAVAAGNHEIECNTDTLSVFEPYETYFRNPNRIRAAERLPVTREYQQTLWHESCSSPSTFLGHYYYGNSFYSYRHGLLHVIVLNSYTYSSQGSPQYKWLQQELAHNVNRQVTPWVMVVFHAPIYTTFLGHINELHSLQMKHAMEPLFVQYGVNFVISGHDHAYMRTESLKLGRIDPTGRAPVYLILGAGGNREGHSHGMQEPVQSWVATRSLQDFGYGHLVIPNATHAVLEWIPDSVPEARDSVWWTNPHASL